MKREPWHSFTSGSDGYRAHNAPIDQQGIGIDEFFLFGDLFPFNYLCFRENKCFILVMLLGDIPGSTDQAWKTNDQCKEEAQRGQEFIDRNLNKNIKVARLTSTMNILLNKPI